MSAAVTTLGPYVLERELGRGAFGVVYRGHHEDAPDTHVAVKTVPVHGDLDRMLVEPALLARLRHPCVVGLREYFVADGQLVLAMEYVPGEDLKAYLDRGETLPPERVRELLVQLGSALAAAHAQQIVHRDLKPSNVLLDTTGGRTRFVLTDFGVGKTAEGLQAEKHVGGTYLYMAPEQLRGRPGPQSDLWALGVVAYQLLTGKLPFPGPSLDELAKQIQYTDPPPPSAVTGTPLPEDLEHAVLGLLKKSLSERTGSAAELLAGLGVKGGTTDVLGSSSEVRKLTRPAVPYAEALSRRARRTTVLLGLAVLVYLLLNGIVVAALLVAGLGLFYYAQAKDLSRGRRAALTAAAFAVLALRFVPSLLQGDEKFVVVGSEANDWVFRLTAIDAGPILSALLYFAVAVVMVIAFLLPVIAAALYARVRRAKREQALLKAALDGHAGSDEFLTLMRDLLDTRFEDVGFHLRYAELLYARGDHRAAAVEARLITVQDPYHFNANLLLANAYYSLRLYDDCRRVCDEYLDVSGYCFEFQELRQLAASRSSSPLPSGVRGQATRESKGCFSGE